MYIAGKYGEL